jgi:hypothetical protein
LATSISRVSYSGADKGPASTVKIKAGKSDSLRVAVDASDAPRNAPSMHRKRCGVEVASMPLLQE